jgi:L-ascorbate metabolism protein UlaG (beta-lactamase superfamily)
MKLGEFLENGMQITVNDIYIKAVAAYNVRYIRPDNVPYHVQGDGNGYFLVIGDKTVYISGDTEYIDEMRFFMKPDVAFITVMMPFTMDEHMCLQLVKRLQPPIIYLLHYNINVKSLTEQITTAIPGVKIRLPY